MSMVSGEQCTAEDLARWDVLVGKGTFPSREIAMAAELAEAKAAARKTSRKSRTRKKPRQRRKARGES